MMGHGGILITEPIGSHGVPVVFKGGSGGGGHGGGGRGGGGGGEQAYYLYRHLLTS